MLLPRCTCLHTAQACAPASACGTALRAWGATPCSISLVVCAPGPLPTPLPRHSLQPAGDICVFLMGQEEIEATTLLQPLSRMVHASECS